MKKNSPILSIIILNYNSGIYLKECLTSITKSVTKYNFETIIIDNASTDKSISLSKKIDLSNSKYLILNKNIGFAAGNNQGVKIINASSKYVLFLNPDTTVEPNTLEKILDFIEKNSSKVDAATCYITLAATGKMQPECHRGFPTPLNAFWHFFGFGLPKIFSKSKFFNGYFQGHLDLTKPHQIDCCVGAFLLVKKEVGESIGWWNEKYFFYGEDLDFCYKLKQKKYHLYFYPDCKITHFQGVSSGIINKTKNISKASRETKIRSALASTNAMKIFYSQNLINKYPKIAKPFIMAGIKLLEIKRVFKAKYL